MSAMRAEAEILSLADGGIVQRDNQRRRSYCRERRERAWLGCFDASDSCQKRFRSGAVWFILTIQAIERRVRQRPDEYKENQ